MENKHSERTKQTAIKWIAGLFIVALVVGSIVLYPNAWHDLLSFGGTSGGNGATTTISSACPPNAQSGTLTFLASNQTPTTGATSYVATPVNVTASVNNNYQSVVYNTKLTTTGGSFTTATCGATYNEYPGDNVNWYINQTSAVAQAGKTIPVAALTYHYSAATALVANAPQTVGAANVLITGLSTGQLVTSAQESIQASAGWFGFPGEGFVVAYPYNNLAVSGIAIPGAQTWTGGQIPISYVLGQDAQADFVFPAIHYNQYATPTGAVSGYTLFSPQIQTSSGFSGTAQVSFVGETILPLCNFVGVNGNYYSSQAVYTVPGINGQSVGTAVCPSTSASYFIELIHS